MKKEDFHTFLERKLEEIISTSRAAQAEYAHGEQDNAFNNFIRLGIDLDMHPMKVLWVYAMKHRDGIAAWLKGVKSQREPVAGRIKDLIIYLFLLWAWVEEWDQRKPTESEKP